MATSDPLPAGGATREEIAQIEVGQTTVEPGDCSRAGGAFPDGYLRGADRRVVRHAIGTRTRRVDGLGPPDERPRRDPLAACPRPEGDGAWRGTVLANRAVLGGLSGFERALENDSLLGQALRPPAQLLMTGWLGAGNERVYPGREGWVFYRPDVEHVTGRGFLDPRELRRRIAAAPEWTDPPEPDPRPAIIQFKSDLANRGIALIVVPVTLKPSVHPEKLTRRYDEASALPQNPSFTAFIEDLRREGVLVFDPGSGLARERSAGAQYLATDTHWRPEAVEAAADELGRMLSESRSREWRRPATGSNVSKCVTSAMLPECSICLKPPPSSRRRRCGFDEC